MRPSVRLAAPFALLAGLSALVATGCGESGQSSTDAAANTGADEAYAVVADGKADNYYSSVIVVIARVRGGASEHTNMLLQQQQQQHQTTTTTARTAAAHPPRPPQRSSLHT